MADPFDIRTAAEKARYKLLVELEALAQYVANDGSPSVYSRFTVLRAITSDRNWTDPRAAADEIQATLTRHAGDMYFAQYLGRAAALVEKYAMAVKAPVHDTEIEQLAHTSPFIPTPNG